MPYCTSCGTESTTNKFCNYCGSNLSTQGSSPKASQVNIGSKRAMWVHLAPLLLACSTSFVGPIIIQASSLIPSAENSFVFGNGFLFGFIPLLVLWVPALVVRISSKSNDFERRHASASLNNQISLFIYISAIILLACVASIRSVSSNASQTIGSIWLVWILAFLVLGAIVIAQLVFSILGSVAGNSGKDYRYPLAIRFFK